MEGSWLPFLNAALLVAQAAVNIAYAKCFVLLARDFESLISPASFAFAIWIPIYALEVLLVLTDLFYPRNSFFADATQPTQLRICFALSCVFNILWLVLHVYRYVVGATVMIFLLWLVLLVLYIYSVNDRTGRASFDWKLYMCNELPIAMYFAWVTCTAFVHLAIALQESHGDYLRISTYVTHLSIIAVFALLAIVYAQDAIFALVAVWYFLAVSSKHVALPAKVLAADLSVRACAGEAAGIIGAMLVISMVSMYLVDRNPPTPTSPSSPTPTSPTLSSTPPTMTAEVNAAAAACPHAAGANSSSAKDGKKQENCGFGSQMMNIAQHAAAGGAWEVTGSVSSRGSKDKLSPEREVSSIPKSDFTPAHQTGAHSYWEYPSEEMYFKAMQRKGWSPEAEQMKTIVAIHNTVNEQSWREVLQWEAKHATATMNTQPPKLKRFIGRPSDFSPKARMLNALGWSVLPFDRHDWIVEREDGTEVRYVIDFYTGQPQPGKPLSVYLDVRPALDSVESVFDRLRWQFDEKIKPLLPFRGAIFGEKAAESDANNAPASTEGRSTVIPRSDA